ncbi:MAG: prolyl oligopeptidase family serine peptidase, partial [Pseudomonadota bacterium]
GVPLNATPLVAVIHGGPWGRINSNYSGITQLLVNRGYSVFEPNFRSSTGYGLHYMTAGNREFGKGVVQQDIIDGVHYLLAQGIGDAERLGIVGGSFGGFSVLNGLAFTPDLFKVGVASVPPAALGISLVKLLNKPGELERDPSMKEMMRILASDVDDPADIKRLYDISPQAHLAAIKAPLLIMAGADDDRVDINHVKQYSLQLFNQGKTLSLLIDEDAGHGYGSARAKHADIYLTELFLSHYLGGALEPLDDPLVAHYIKRRMLMNSNTAVSVN